ncbi:MAG: hypothetical protein WCS72_17560, partial [Deltaproteobacteria bacterium]
MKILNLAMAIGTAVGAMRLFRVLGGNRHHQAIPGLLVFTAPTMVSFVVVAKNDVANGFIQTLTALACIEYLRRPRWAIAAFA